MRGLVDLRYVYVVPALINIGKPWVQQPNLISNEMFVKVCVFLAIAILVFLFTSVKLPLTITVEPPQWRAGDFSSPLTLSFLASLFLPSPLFWFVFPMLVILSPWYGIIVDLLKRFILWFSHILQAIPTHIIICVTQRPRDDHEPHEEADLV
jgi:hypothetical protein